MSENTTSAPDTGTLAPEEIEAAMAANTADEMAQSEQEAAEKPAPADSRPAPLARGVKPSDASGADARQALREAEYARVSAEAQAAASEGQAAVAEGGAPPAEATTEAPTEPKPTTEPKAAPATEPKPAAAPAAEGLPAPLRFRKGGQRPPTNDELAAEEAKKNLEGHKLTPARTEPPPAPRESLPVGNDPDCKKLLSREGAAEVTVHFGKNTGRRVDSLLPEQVAWYLARGEEQIAAGECRGADAVLYRAVSNWIMSKTSTFVAIAENPDTKENVRTALRRLFGIEN